MSKQTIGILSILLVMWLIMWYKNYSDITRLNNAHKEIIKYKMQIDELQEPSQIEKDEIELKKAELDSIAYWKLEAESKKRKEESIWKTRCLKKKIVWEEDICDNDLERFAVYVK